MSALQEIVDTPPIETTPKKYMALGNYASIVVVILLCVAPLIAKNFVIFQMTMVLIYAIAVLALNILTGGSGQFSLGQSAFYALGAYTSAILMETFGVNYALTLPVAGGICFIAGYLFGQPALRLSGIYLALATFALATAMPQLLKLHYFEAWTGGVQGLVITKPDAPFGLPLSQDMWLYYFVLVVSMVIYVASVNLLKSRSGRAMMAIRDNEIAASAMGVDVALYKTLAFGVSAASPASPAVSAPSRCSSWRRTATPSSWRSRCSSAWWSAASVGCPARSSARRSSCSCRTSPSTSPRVCPARCSA
jgi:branched-chain amino acid transport system permease protein